jgi:hypothetical protein
VTGRRRWAVAVVVVASVLAGCTITRDGDDESPAPPTDAPQGGDTAGDAPTDAPVEIPDTPAGDALAWVLDHVGSPPDEGEVGERFDETFLDAIPPAGLRSVLGSLGQAGELVEMVHSGDHELAVLAEVGDDVLQIQLVVEPEPPHRMTGLVFTPAIPTPPFPTSLGEVEEAWVPLAPAASLLVAQVVNGECRPVAAVDPERAGPVGSTAKLYVLGAVAAAVLDGSLAWDDPVPIRDELRSHPSGTFHELPTGTERTVLEHATAMISVSDNTATDHLIDLVGREAVEDAVIELGNSRPDLNRPFLTTREAFLLKLDGVSEEGLDEFLGGGEVERRALLDAWASLPLPGLEAFSPTPVLIDEVEWFASPDDLCRAMVVLGELAEWPGLEPLDEVLRARDDLLGPDVDLEGAVAWFKGGSEPGVLNLTVRLDDGDRVVVASGTLTDPATIRVPAGGLLGWLVATAQLALG